MLKYAFYARKYNGDYVAHILGVNIIGRVLCQQYLCCRNNF